jgi:hypothetical protein
MKLNTDQQGQVAIQRGDGKGKTFEAMSTWEKFSSVYAAKFGGLTDKDGIEYWKQSLSGYDWKILEECLEKMGSEYDRDSFGKRPRIGRVIEICRNIRKEKGFDNPYRSFPAGSVKCVGCSDSGWRKAVYDYVTRGLSRVDRARENTALRLESLSVQLVPCWCETGKKHNVELGYDEHGLDFIRKNSFPFSFSDPQVIDEFIGKKVA